MDNDLVLFKDGQFELNVTVTPEKDTVWLNRNQIVALFNRDVKTIGKHINNALSEELSDLPTVAKFATVQKKGTRNITRQVAPRYKDIMTHREAYKIRCHCLNKL